MIHTIWYSIRRPASYKRLAEQKLSRLVLTLFAFFTLLAGSKALFLAQSVNPFLSFMEQEFPAKMPPFRYNGSELRVDAPTPVTLSTINGYTVIVDVSEPVPRNSLNKIRSGVVLGKTALYVVTRGTEQSFSYRDGLMLLYPLTKEEVLQIIPFLKPVLAIGLVISVLVMIAWSFVQVTLFSLLAALFASLQKVSLPYRQAWLTAAFSLIPASLIDLLNFFMRSPYLSLAFWVAVLTYIYHGVGSFKKGNDAQ